MRNGLKTVLLLGALAGLLVGLGALVGGRGGATIGLVLAVVMNFGSYWFSDKIALKMSGARPVQRFEAPQLYEIVENLTLRAHLPMPSIHVIPSDQANAFATGRNPKHAAVAVTEGIMRVLDRDELEGVLAHELAHVKHRDILITSVAATVAAAISWIATMARWGAIFGGGRDDDERGGLIALLAASIVAPIAALVVQMAISRSREFDADAGGAGISGRPDRLASALRKIEQSANRTPMPVSPAAAPLFIVNPLRGAWAQGTARMFMTHPPIEERVKRLDEMSMRAY